MWQLIVHLTHYLKTDRVASVEEVLSSSILSRVQKRLCALLIFLLSLCCGKLFKLLNVLCLCDYTHNLIKGLESL